MSAADDAFLRSHPSLRRRYDSELRRLGKGCTDCDKKSLTRKFTKELIKAEVKASLKKRR